jgi:hypothetical protein
MRNAVAINNPNDAADASSTVCATLRKTRAATWFLVKSDTITPGLLLLADAQPSICDHLSPLVVILLVQQISIANTKRQNRLLVSVMLRNTHFRIMVAIYWYFSVIT